MQSRVWLLILIILLAPLPYGAWVGVRSAYRWWVPESEIKTEWQQVDAGPPRVREQSGMVRIAAGRTILGSSSTGNVDRQPAHEVWLDPFWIDAKLVTNDQFAEFVKATDFSTTAERRGSSLVFDYDRREWLEVEMACWKSPEGPLSTLADRGNLPVVHVSWHDALAYAEWANKRLVTEAEYELAARGGLIDNQYAWGNELSSDQPEANYWQGRFPHRDLGLDGFRGPSPVGSFPPNRFGLYDMTGNVWCWCADWYAADYYYSSPLHNPPGPPTGQARTLRGGSWLSTGGAGSELAVTARGHAPPHHTASNVGFRCAGGPPATEIAAKSKRRR
ncbi:Serine/threonine-protein kinase pkn1 [Aeoliella mucimassa]|uniref:Serine/threonine-protein kinase pkn1 n=1 Tax=Aeoliella mucimassa TaxID=2527972 RepID=A0A518AID1_9BACT|nr:Serine/threonine-protein kinase pkn1 [Aeoliella mucimassa]